MYHFLFFLGCGVDNASMLLDAFTRPSPIPQESFILAGVMFPDGLKNMTHLPKNLPVSMRFPGLARIYFDPQENKEKDSSYSSKRGNWDTSYLFPKNPTPGARNPEDIYGGPPGKRNCPIVQNF